MNQTVDATINKSGFWVVDRYHSDGLRTYACTDRQGLEALIYHLTGREADTYSQDDRSLPELGSLGITIASGLHIWSGTESETKKRD